MAYVVNFETVSTEGLESSPVAAALAGLRANEARYFKNKYNHVFTVEPASANPAAIDRAFFGGMAIYSVLGCAHQDWRRRRTGGSELAAFFAETSFLPFVAIATGRNRLVLRELRPLVLVGAAGLYVAIFVFHHRIFA